MNTMNIDANAVIEKLTLQIARQSKQMAIMEAQIDMLYSESEKQEVDKGEE